jgi:hypothetical protein
MTGSRSRSARPQTLHDVAARATAGEAFDPLLHEFLDEVYTADDARRPAMIAAEPPPVGTVHDAYVAAVAEHLALRFGLPVPAWTEKPARFLDRPFFAGRMEGMKALLLAESPLAFRRRLLFVSHGALSRPRDPAAAR